MTTTLRATLEKLVLTHPYDPVTQTCECKLGLDENVPWWTRDQHAAHVTALIFVVLNGVEMASASARE